MVCVLGVLASREVPNDKESVAIYSVLRCQVASHLPPVDVGWWGSLMAPAGAWALRDDERDPPRFQGDSQGEMSGNRIGEERGRAGG